MKSVKTVFNVLSIIFAIILVFWITQINFDNLSYKENVSPFLGILSMLMMSIAMQMIGRGINKKNKDK
jgi:hypothetical protein